MVAARRIGIDFDNTIVCYDRAFAAAAEARGWMGADVEQTKKGVRDAVRLLPAGETKWQILQAEVYGPGIGAAAPFDGVIDFLTLCRERGWAVAVVSHKTEYATYGDRSVKLPDAALDWMDAHGLIGKLIERERIHFEPTRAAKLARIGALGLSDFIDDLVEVFEERDFPPGVARWLFERGAAPSRRADGIAQFSDWRWLAARLDSERALHAG